MIFWKPRHLEGSVPGLSRTSFQRDFPIRCSSAAIRRNLHKLMAKFHTTGSAKQRCLFSQGVEFLISELLIKRDQKWSRANHVEKSF